MFIASLGLVFGLMTGCGSSGGSSDSGDHSDGGITVDKVNDQMGSIADDVGCTYTEITSAKKLQPDVVLSIKTTKIIGKVIESKKELPMIAGTEAGNCGGSVTMPDDFFGDFVFDNYCYQDEDSSARINVDGSLNVGTNDAGNFTASTLSPLRIRSTVPDTGENVDVTIQLDRGVLAINDDGTYTITANSVRVNDNITGDVYTATNLSVHTDGHIANFTGVLNPGTDTGELYIRGSVNIDSQQGTITITDSDGVVVIITTTGVEGVFNVTYNGAPLGIMDCSMIEVPI